MSGLWGYQSALDLYLQENGITTLLFGGVNTDQCVGGTLVDAYFRGYDCVLVGDITATTSPAGGLENVFYNTTNVSITFIWISDRYDEDCQGYHKFIYLSIVTTRYDMNRWVKSHIFTRKCSHLHHVEFQLYNTISSNYVTYIDQGPP
ncbi:hypothetical protein J3R82DRAFT_756 [Butyriboletus roseoflavus]|nr:hypothetical protein J3R82DRAFT_756 [Butyriboletus roseoflavus]